MSNKSNKNKKLNKKYLIISISVIILAIITIISLSIKGTISSNDKMISDNKTKDKNTKKEIKVKYTDHKNDWKQISDDYDIKLTVVFRDSINNTLIITPDNQEKVTEKLSEDAVLLSEEEFKIASKSFLDSKYCGNDKAVCDYPIYKNKNIESVYNPFLLSEVGQLVIVKDSSMPPFNPEAEALSVECLFDPSVIEKERTVPLTEIINCSNTISNEYYKKNLSRVSTEFGFLLPTENEKDHLISKIFKNNNEYIWFRNSNINKGGEADSDVFIRFDKDKNVLYVFNKSSSLVEANFTFYSKEKYTLTEYYIKFEEDKLTISLLKTETKYTLDEDLDKIYDSEEELNKAIKNNKNTSEKTENTPVVIKSDIKKTEVSYNETDKLDNKKKLAIGKAPELEHIIKKTKEAINSETSSFYIEKKDNILRYNGKQISPRCFSWLMDTSSFVWVKKDFEDCFAEETTEGKLIPDMSKEFNENTSDINIVEMLNIKDKIEDANKNWVYDSPFLYKFIPEKGILITGYNGRDTKGIPNPSASYFYIELDSNNSEMKLYPLYDESTYEKRCWNSNTNELEICDNFQKL